MCFELLAPPRCFIPNTKTLGRVAADKKLFHVSPYIRQCKTWDPGRGGAIFGFWGIV